MCKFFRKLFKFLAVVAAIAGIAAAVFYFLQKKEAQVDETLDSLDEAHEEPAAETDESRMQKISRYSKDLLEKRSYIKIPFHEA